MLGCDFSAFTGRDVNKTAIRNIPLDDLTAIRFIISQFMVNETNGHSCIKRHLLSVWHVFVGLYVIVGVAGLVGNVYMISGMCRNTRFQRFVNFLLFNLCLSDLVSVFTHLLVALDRYLLIVHDSNRSHHSTALYLALLSGLWLGSASMLLPLRAYMKFYPLETVFGRSFRGWGFCTVQFSSNIREVNVAQFIGLFAIPLVVTAYLHAKSSEDLKARIRSTMNTELQVPRDQQQQSQNQHNESHNNNADNLFSSMERERSKVELGLEATRCLFSLAILFGTCWTPLHCLLLVFYVVPERAERVPLVDFLFLLFALLGFASTLTGPLYLFFKPVVFQSFLSRGIQLIRRLSSRRNQSSRTRTSRRGGKTGGRRTATGSGQQRKRSRSRSPRPSASHHDRDGGGGGLRSQEVSKKSGESHASEASFASERMKLAPMSSKK